MKKSVLDKFKGKQLSQEAKKAVVGGAWRCVDGQGNHLGIYFDVADAIAIVDENGGTCEEL